MKHVAGQIANSTNAGVHFAWKNRRQFCQFSGED